MKNKLSLILIIVINFCYGQKKAPPVLTRHVQINKNYKPVSLNKRIAKYPFNEATKIKLVSYNLAFKKDILNYPAPPPPKTKEDSINLELFYNKPKPISLNNVLEDKNLDGLTESKILNLSEISELTNILSNTCGKYSIGVFSKTGCFFPRNAILFYDEKDEIFAMVEICFQCSGIETKPRNIFDNSDLCDYIYPELETFFQKIGLQTKYIETK